MRQRRALLGVWALWVLSLGAALGGVGAAVAEAATAPPPPNALSQPLKDGCQRSIPGLLARTSPEWTYVYNPPPSQPAPAPRWAWGAVRSGNPSYLATHVSGGDLPQGHTAYDFNVNLLVDSPYSYLLGGSPTTKTGNYAGNGEEVGRLHTEWEDLTIPKFAWAEQGDRVGEKGSWVWDCGHWGTPYGTFSPDSITHGCAGAPDLEPAAPQCPLTGEETEFHPYRAIWINRAQPSRSPYGENQADLFISTDQTPAGREADCAHEHPPPPAATSYGPDYTACLDSGHNWQDVSGRYSFFLPLPPRPSSGGTRPRIRAINRGSVDAPAPTLRRSGDGFRVTFSLRSRPNQRLVMGYTFLAGWTRTPISRLPTHLRVRFDTLVIHRAMDPGCTLGVPLPACSLESTRTTQLTTAPGEWDLYWDLSGIWGAWAPGSGEFTPTDGESFPGTQTVDLYVPPGKGWTLTMGGRECDIGAAYFPRPMADCPTDHELADDNDVPGTILDRYPSAVASLGTHTSDALTAKKDPTSTCPDANPHGCYSLTYTVTLVNDKAQRARQLARPGRRARRRIRAKAPVRWQSPRLPAFTG